MIRTTLRRDDEPVRSLGVNYDEVGLAPTLIETTVCPSCQKSIASDRFEVHQRVCLKRALKEREKLEHLKQIAPSNQNAVIEQKHNIQTEQTTKEMQQNDSFGSDNFQSISQTQNNSQPKLYTKIQSGGTPLFYSSSAKRNISQNEEDLPIQHNYADQEIEYASPFTVSDLPDNSENDYKPQRRTRQEIESREGFAIKSTEIEDEDVSEFSNVSQTTRLSALGNLTSTNLSSTILSPTHAQHNQSGALSSRSSNTLKSPTNVASRFKQTPQLVQCKFCGRSFFPDRIEKHEGVCQLKAEKEKEKEWRGDIKEKKKIGRDGYGSGSVSGSSISNGVNSASGQSSSISSSIPYSSHLSNTNTHQRSLKQPSLPQKQSTSHSRRNSTVSAQSFPAQNTTPSSLSSSIASPLPAPTLSELYEQVTNMESKRKRCFNGLLLYRSSALTPETCIGEVLYEPDRTIIDELPLLVEEQLAVRIKPERMMKNGFIPIFRGQLSFYVNEVFRKEEDVLVVEEEVIEEENEIRGEGIEFKARNYSDINTGRRITDNADMIEDEKVIT
ncbi:uncharacterized protein MONOS_5014 [Monocercomonoides exilis]|uniref:uncharacterized protein n=1 Tax=Monocercomonoides exilis TaxID=2049356 RepID=UPI00355A0F3D|nr:hypothetical protein MONOS_5014 [Monocercomonoides exilis]|eukprot:MONOS_5014.1-p1 / transcript=MONOS_5014.1 / gene=MONOS_5014 / organism=Monocercomonoides_exilis_PA203 / gene_product=unspecified product / transcript_product=unspecified product / location=Mono_scaffold00141:51128-53490(-) / protein_length=555 / sequence_SO=supercontig / SO=protein_coding / is_pseudo=false